MLRSTEMAKRSKHFKKVDSDPRNPATYVNLAVQAERMDRIEEALNAYEKFLTISDEKNFSQQRQKS